MAIGAWIAMSSQPIEELCMRLVDSFYSLPYLLIVMLILLLIGPGLLSIILALSLTGWTTMMRIVRFEFKSHFQKEYVQYVKLLGASKSHIFFKHLLPNSMKTIIGAMGLTIPSAIFAESFLSFLGLGVQAPLASLGSMASDSLASFEYYPWRLLAPLITITLLILGFNLALSSFHKKKFWMAHAGS